MSNLLEHDGLYAFHPGYYVEEVIEDMGISHEEFAALLRTLRELGGEVVLNADAHDRALLSGGFAEALALVRDCGFDHVNVLTREETDVPADNTAQDVRFTDGVENVPLYWKRTALS